MGLVTSLGRSGPAHGYYSFTAEALTLAMSSFWDFIWLNVYLDAGGLKGLLWRGPGVLDKLADNNRLTGDEAEAAAINRGSRILAHHEKAVGWNHAVCG